MVVSAFTPPAQQKNNEPFSITLTNTGEKASSAETLTVLQQPWADGPDGRSYTSHATVPVLQPGESVTLKFEAVDYDSDSIDGDIYLNNVFQQDFSFWG